jgi:hypothetical protein
VSKYLDTRTDDGELPATRRSGINCAEASDLIPALALGAIETGERHALRLHCQSCPACADVLEASGRVAAYLPFSSPVKSPPDRAKHALFARIADAHPASAVSSPTFTSIAPIDAPVIASPAGKRRVDPAGSRTPLSIGEPGVVSGTQSVLTRRVGRFAAGPLALAFVLMTFYSLQGMDLPFSDSTVPTATSTASAEAAAHPPAAGDEAPAQSADASSTDTTLINTTFANSNSGETTPDGSGVTLLNVDTQGASSAGPLLQQYSSNSSGAFVYKAVGSGQTSLLGTVNPNFADCSVVKTESGAYILTVSGVHLPGGTGIAGVYLVTDAGERIYVADVAIDERGDGKVTFETDRPLDAYRTLVIGMARQEVGAAVSNPLYGTVTFPLTTTEVLRGLSPAS